ncbi:MAG: flagellar motor switch protein FliM [Pseudomonadota bacterium]
MAEEDNKALEDDAAALEWEKMIAAEDAAKDGASGSTDDATKTSEQAPPRVLNQDEIDLLLGFDPKDEKDKNSGIFAILDKALSGFEKMPMLEVVFDRLVRMLASSLRNFTSETVELNLISISSLRFDDYLNSIPLPALLVVFRAVEWENLAILTVDSSLIYSTVDVLLGGRRSARPIRIEGRPYTTIEQDIVRRMSEIILSDLSTAFDPISPVTFQFERIETTPRFATITRPNNPALLVRLRVDMEDRGGGIEILFPHTTLEPIRELLLQIFMGEKFGQDIMWERHFSKEVRQTEIELEVVLDEKKITLGDVMKFQVGNTLLLERSPDDDVMIRSNGVTITTGKAGRMGDNIAVSISEPIRKKIKEQL